MIHIVDKKKSINKCIITLTNVFCKILRIHQTVYRSLWKIAFPYKYKSCLFIKFVPYTYGKNMGISMV